MFGGRKWRAIWAVTCPKSAWCLHRDGIPTQRICCIDRALLLFQVSRSIGDAYLKNVEFNREPLLSKFRLPEPFYRPILKAEPTISVQKLFPEDQFLIFASDGLWEHLSNQEAVDIVQSCPRNVRIPIYSFEPLLYIGWIFYHGFVSN